PEERQAGGPLRDLAAVADLAARLGVERRLVEHDDAPLAHTEALDRRALPIQGGDPRRRGELLVAPEARGLARVFDRPARAESPGRARLLALARHRGRETGLVRADAGLPADIGCQVEREAVGVVQPERGLAVEPRPLAAAQRREGGLEDLHAVGDGLEETFLLQAQHLGDAPGLRAQL